jgi:hypothetical protein
MPWQCSKKKKIKETNLEKESKYSFGEVGTNLR